HRAAAHRGRCRVRDPRTPRAMHGRSRSPDGPRVPLPDAGGGQRRDPERRRGHEDRRELGPLLQHARERRPRLRRKVRGRPSHRAVVGTRRRGTARPEPRRRARIGHVSRRVLPRAAQRALRCPARRAPRRRRRSGRDAQEPRARVLLRRRRRPDVDGGKGGNPHQRHPLRRGRGDGRGHGRDGVSVLLRDARRRRQGEGIHGPRGRRRDPARRVHARRAGRLTRITLAEMEPILLVRCDAFETYGVALPALGAAGATTRIWEATDPDAERPNLRDASGVVVFGSTSNVEHADDRPFIKEVADLTREAVERDVPFLGLCFGAQVLAWALGADVVKAPLRELGFEPIRTLPAAADDPVLSHYADGDPVFHWHEDTFELPEGATLLATSEMVPNQAYRVGGSAWATQFHLEVDAAE